MGDGLVILGQGLAPLGGANARNGASQTPEILTNPLDPVWLLHSLRRRWVLALGMGLLVGSVLAAVVWYLTPSMVTAAASILVSQRRKVFVSNVDFGDAEFETFKKTQVDFIKSVKVLLPALSYMAENGGLPQVIAEVDEPDRIRWLKDNLDVGFPSGPGAEFLTISIECEREHDAMQIVKAVVKEYMTEIVGSDYRMRLGAQETLQTELNLRQDDLTRRRKKHIEEAKAVGDPSSPDWSVRRNLIFEEQQGYIRRKQAVENELTKIALGVTLLQNRMSDPMLVDMSVENMLRNAPEIQAIQIQLNDLAVRYASEASKAKSRSTPQLQNIQKQQDSLNQMLEQTRQELKPTLKHQLLTNPNSAIDQQIRELEQSKTFYEGEVAKYDAEIAARATELEKLSEKSLTLLDDSAEIERMQRMNDGMATKLQALRVEDNAPNRIQDLQDCYPIPGYNTLQRTIMVTMGGLFGLALTCFGVAFWDFRHRKLNGPSQMDEGLGIRVLGVLPRLAIRKNADADPILAVLTEAVDNVRTSLMHASTSSKTQIVLVTSAGEQEGRTTVASQLAASLARAGRRTLLVDGDLRHPSLDRLFDVPLADGLCELLRAEVDIADAVRPTNAEGLWLLTAGYGDVAAVQALAREQAQPIFDKLREDFDFVIIDAAPVLNLSDSLIMGQYTDGAVLSVVRDHSRARKIYEASELLKQVGVKVLGCVVNGVTAPPTQRVQRLWLESPEASEANV